MSSAASHSAFKSVLLVECTDATKNNITCCVHYSSRVLVGTDSGHLLLYDTRKRSSSSSSSSSKVTTQPIVSMHISDKKISEIKVIPHIRTVFTLSDGVLEARNATDLEPLAHEFGMLKNGVRCFCVNERGPPHFRICVAIKKKIVLFQFNSREKKYAFLRDFSIPDTPETMNWYRNKITVAFRKEYQIMNDKTGESIAVPLDTGGTRLSVPLVKLMPNEEVILAAMDRVGVWIDFTGTTLPKNPINWSNAPACLVYTKPYLVAFIPNEGLQIHNVNDQSLVQTIPSTQIRYLSGNGMKWDMEPRTTDDSENLVLYACAGSNNLINQVHKLDPVPFDLQLGILLDKGLILQAQELVEASLVHLPREQRNKKLVQFYRQAGVGLLRRLQFQESIQYLYKANVDFRELLCFFPDLHSSNFAFEPVLLKEQVLPRTVKSKTIKSSSSSSSSKSNLNMAKVIESALHDPKRISPELSSEANYQPDSLIVSARKALVHFLEMYKYTTESSKRSKLKDDPILQECLNIALFRLYVTSRINMDELRNFLKKKENIVEKEMIALLSQNQYYFELGLLYQTLHKESQALDVWTRLQSGEYVNMKNAKNPSESINSLSRDAILELLVVTNDSKLIYEFTTVFLTCDGCNFSTKTCSLAKHHVNKLSENGQKVIDMLVNRSPLMDTDTILNHFRKSSIESTSLCRTYLELTSSSNCKTNATGSSTPNKSQQLNNRLSRANSVKTDSSYQENSGSSISSSSLNNNSSLVGGGKDCTQLGLQYLEEVYSSSSSSCNFYNSKKNKEPAYESRKRLLGFLSNMGNYYNGKKIAREIKMQQTKSKIFLGEEYVICCFREAQYKEALEVLVEDRSDFIQAEEFCLLFGREEVYSKALLAMVKVCFACKDEKKKNDSYEAAYRVMARHAKNMPATEILQLIPSNTSIVKLMDYFTQALPYSTHMVHQSMIERNLANIYNLQVQCDVVDSKTRNVEIEQNTVCEGCGKRIGDIVFAVYPNNTIVHYNCTNGNLNKCPITGEQFNTDSS